MARTINNTINGPLILSLSDPLASGGSDDPLTITSTGTISSTSDGIDGGASVSWIIYNAGVVSSDGNVISLGGNGYLFNSGSINLLNNADNGVVISGQGFVSNSGFIGGYGNGFLVEMGSGVVLNSGNMGSILGEGVSLGTGMVENLGYIGGGVVLGSGTIVNAGTIWRNAFGDAGGVSVGSGTIFNSGEIASIRYGVSLGNGSGFFNQSTGFVIGRSASLNAGTGVTVVNQGTMSGGENGGVDVGDNSSVTNSGTMEGILGVEMGAAGTLVNSGFIQGEEGVSMGSGRLSNQGTIIGGISLAKNGTVINTGSIQGEIQISTGSGTIINDGALTGTYAPNVDFEPGTTNNLLEIGPAATFQNVAEATSGSNSTIQLSAGTAVISEIGTGQFDGFDTLSVVANADWTLNATDTIGTVLNNGTVAVAGSFDVSTAVDPASKGVFGLLGGSTLEVAAAIGAKSQMSFSAPSELAIDHASLFGTHVGASSYTGPLLEDFIAGATIDLKDFGFAGLTAHYATGSGLLQLTNGAAQAATLHFQNASLGSGAFHYAADGAGGLLITHS